jgi:hypothetical protein
MEKSEEIKLIEKDISNPNTIIEEEKLIEDENSNKRELKRFGHTFTLSNFYFEK